MSLFFQIGYYSKTKNLVHVCDLGQGSYRSALSCSVWEIWSKEPERIYKEPSLHRISIWRDPLIVWGSQMCYLGSKNLRVISIYSLESVVRYTLLVYLKMFVHHNVAYLNFKYSGITHKLFILILIFCMYRNILKENN